MLHWSNSVLSGDTANHEARASAYYWKNLFKCFTFDKCETFTRDRFGEPPNNYLITDMQF